jgi:hypothetical protein
VGQDRESVEGTPRRPRKIGILVFAVACVLTLAACGYFIGSMLGWWVGSDWLSVAAAVVLGSVIFAGRVYTK